MPQDNKKKAPATRPAPAKKTPPAKKGKTTPARPAAILSSTASDITIEAMQRLANAQHQTLKSPHTSERGGTDRKRGTSRKERVAFAKKVSARKTRDDRNKPVPIESFLLIPLNSADVGMRPLAHDTPFSTSSVGIGTGDRPFVVVKNIGNRPLFTVLAEFSCYNVGTRVESALRKSVGFSAIPTQILPGQAIRIESDTPFVPAAGQPLFATVYDPLFDPPSSFCNPIVDRHTGQNSYPYLGIYDGQETLDGRSFLSRAQISVAAGGMYNIKIFLQVGGGLPTAPQIDMTLLPAADGFQFHHHYSFKEEDWKIWMRDNNTIAYTTKKIFTDMSGRAPQEILGTLFRK